MSKDLTWLEAATKTLETADELWMTAPELVRAITESGIRSLKSDYGQAVRTLRAALNYESKKDNGNFLRKDHNFNCYFALRKMVGNTENAKISRSPAKPARRANHSNKPARKPRAVTRPRAHTPPQVNGYPSSPSTPHTPSTPFYTLTASGTPTVEIDPSVIHLHKDTDNRFCLPSPLSSLLGPRRTLNVLNESNEVAVHRPMREARKRRQSRDKERENEDPVGSGLPSPTTSSEEVVQLEVCHSLPCLTTSVDCVRSVPIRASTRSSSLREDPCAAQGDRDTSQSVEINPNYIHQPDEESDTSSESNSESESVRLQPTPSSQLLVKRRHCRLRSRVQFDESSQTEDTCNSESELTETSVSYSPPPVPDTPSEPEYNTGIRRKRRRQPESESSIISVGVEEKVPPPTRERKGMTVSVTDRINKVAEGRLGGEPQRRHVSTLFLPSSPLLSENLKTLLGMNMFEGLTVSQKEKLIKHLPAVDQQNGIRISGDCFTNSFYSSALREWNERLAIGMFTAEHKAKVRVEEKRKMSLKPEDSWKAQYYERHYGDRASIIREDSPPPYYPYTQPGTNTELLTSIIDGYFHREPKDSQCATAPPATMQQSRIQRAQNAEPTPVSPKQKGKVIPKEVKSPHRKSVSKPSKSVNSSKKPVPSPKKSKLKPAKNSVATKSKHSKEKKSSLNSIVKKKNLAAVSLVSKNRASPKKLAVKRLGAPPSSLSPLLMHKMLKKSSNLPKEFLTRLPAKMSYQEILHNLIAASTSNPLSSEPCKMTKYTPPYEHTHSVFHDHYALLSKEHVPVDFCFRVQTLPLSIPRHFYATCAQAKAITREHSYAKGWNPRRNTQKSFTLSLPRSLLSMNGCACDGQAFAMVFCSVCRSLYHSVCTDATTLCPSCSVLKQQM